MKTKKRNNPKTILGMHYSTGPDTEEECLNA